MRQEIRIFSRETDLVHILVGTRSTEAVDTKLLVGISLPAHGAHDLNRQRGDTVGQDGESVLLGLSVEDLEARNGDEAGLDAVLLLEVLGSLQADGDLRTSGNQGDVGTRDLTQDVTTLAGLLNGGTLELGQVLSGQSENAGGVLGGQGDVVSGAGLVAVGRAPDHAVGQSTEMGQSLNRLVSRTILSKTNGVVGGNPDDADPRQGRETDSSGSVGDEVEESTAIRQDSAVGSETVHDGTHGVLTDTVADISASVVTETGGLGLEVNSALPASQVGTSQISRATEELGNGVHDLAQNGLGKLARSDSSISRSVDGQVLLPALGQITLLSSLEVSGLVGEALGVLGNQLVPLLLVGGALRRVLAVEIIDLLGDVESLIGEAPLLLELLDVIGLEGRTVNTVGALLERAVADGGLELDQ